MIRPTPGTVRQDFGEASDPQVVVGDVKDPAAFRACAIDPSFRIDLHAVGTPSAAEARVAKMRLLLKVLSAATSKARMSWCVQTSPRAFSAPWNGYSCITNSSLLLWRLVLA
jgi:hypothetical protein